MTHDSVRAFDPTCGGAKIPVSIRVYDHNRRFVHAVARFFPKDASPGDIQKGLDEAIGEDWSVYVNWNSSSLGVHLVLDVRPAPSLSNTLGAAVSLGAEDTASWPLFGMLGIGTGVMIGAPLAVATPLGAAVAGSAAKLVGSGGLGLSTFSVAGQYGVQAYSSLLKLVGGKGLHCHHIIEQRFFRFFTESPRNWPAIVLTRAEHKVFTDAWRTLIGYNNYNTALRTSNVTVEQVLATARKIYKDYPDLLKAVDEMAKMVR